MLGGQRTPASEVDELRIGDPRGAEASFWTPAVPIADGEPGDMLVPLIAVNRGRRFGRRERGEITLPNKVRPPPGW